MKIFRFHNELGRSMVEMLGTLAIMGVLSIGGISGYTTAMNNHKANEALNDAKRLAMMISSERMLGKTGVLDSKEYEKGLYTFSQGDDQGKIVLTVQDIPSGVANKLNKMKDDLQIADIIIVNNNVTFEFMNDLSGKPSVVGTDQNQGEQGQSENGEQQGTDPCDNIICQHNGQCSNGVCDCTGTGYTGTYCETPTSYDCTSPNGMLGDEWYESSVSVGCDPTEDVGCEYDEDEEIYMAPACLRRVCEEIGEIGWYAEGDTTGAPCSVEGVVPHS